MDRRQLSPTLGTRQQGCVTWIQPLTRVSLATSVKVHNTHFSAVSMLTGRETRPHVQVDTDPRVMHEDSLPHMILLNFLKSQI